MGSATTLTLSFTLTPYKSTAFTTRRTSTNTTISALFLSPIQASHHGPCYWECKKGLKFAFSSKTNWVQIVSPKEYEDDEFVVVNFYRFVYIEDPEKEVSKHLSFLQGRDIHGRIYLNEQGINAQYSGPYKDVIAYVTWPKEDNRFSDILVQISLSFSGHAFPRIKMRYKPSLVQV